MAAGAAQLQGVPCGDVGAGGQGWGLRGQARVTSLPLS